MDKLDSIDLDLFDWNYSDLQILCDELSISEKVDNITPVTKKPKKKYYVKVNSVPRILKRDIRRDYGRMFANVHNSTDYNMVDSFFRFIFYPDCQIIRCKKLIPTSLKSTTNTTIDIVTAAEDTANILTLFNEATLLAAILHSFLLGSCFPDFVVKVSNQSDRRNPW